MKRSTTAVIRDIAIVILASAAILYLFGGQIAQWLYAPTPSKVDRGVQLDDVEPPPPAPDEPTADAPTPSTPQPVVEADPGPQIEVVVQDLDIPWEIAFLPDGDMLVTERPGRLLRIGSDKVEIRVDGVSHVGEAGLLGMVLHPDFKDNGLLYLYMTAKSDDGLRNRVERYRLDGTTLTERKIIIENIPGAIYHDGGRMAFGPDGMLYVTTGDSGNSALAQNRSSLAGKILRVKDDGAIPEDNPFGSPVYSYGHRNPQGLAWDAAGRLWATEHGRSGALSGLDELNLIEKGKNYGWPVIQGDAKKEGMETPVLHSGASDTWAPSGAAFLGGSVFFSGLRGETLYEAKIPATGTKVELRAHLRKDFGRLRAVVVGPDGHLYVSTSNRDGRGDVHPGDDKIIRIDPVVFSK